MSGTSLDGLDIAYCDFKRNGKGWSYSLRKATTIKYTSAWVDKLSSAHHFSGEDLVALDVSFGKFLGKACRQFITRHRIKPDFIASHGHTIFHQPKKGFTYQLGNGTAIHVESGIPTVYDFRSLDVILGGEGAPLVPAGDKFLFGVYEVCLNLGGIANLSMDIKGKRIAYDITFGNMGLNYLMNTIGKTYDDKGRLTSTGTIHPAMFKELGRVLKPIRKRRPSLGREIFEQRIKPILDTPGIALQDKLRTFTAFCVQEISTAVLSSTRNGNVLCTGGGAFNSFFISELLDALDDEATLILPDPDTIKYKEAIVFAFLGIKKVLGEVNCLQSVTGATRDSSSGVLAGF